MKNKAQISNAILIALIIFENLFLYYFFKKRILTQGINAISYFLTSILFGIALAYKFYNADIQENAAGPIRNNKAYYGLILLLIMGLIVMGFQADTMFRSWPITFRSSDIIPQIQILCKRVLTGEYPYNIINDFGGPQTVTYLPMQWLPFTIAELLHIDYRWVSYGAWCIAAAWLCIRSIKISSPAIRALAPLIIFASYYVLFNANNGILGNTVELLVAGYYMIFIVSLNQQSGIFQGIIIAFCLLSRYSLVLWLPLYFFVLFITKNRKQLYLSMATAAVLVLVIYVIPFLSKDWTIFYRGYKYYDGATFFEWTHVNSDGKPYQLFAGTGYAYYFYTRFTNMDIPSRIFLLEKVHVACCLLITIIMGAWFWFNREKINHKIFLLSSFKIYLAVFLFLIQIPYEYLMCVSNFVSIAIFCEQARYRLIEKET